MKKIVLFLPLLLLFSFSRFDPGPTKAERKFALSYYKKTQKDLEQSISNLSEAQLNFKAGPDRWSVKECLQHILLTEAGLWQMTQGIIKSPANPEKRTEIKVTDEQLIKMITDRSQKAQAPEPFRPGKGQPMSVEDMLLLFQSQRATITDYIKETSDDLRNHVTNLPFGMIDSYQLLLMISAHCNRHTQQINEVKANPDFPRE